ncbi:MAG TPA: zinc ABC transporter permease subunit ZnuB [Pseudomonadales bacterium]
MVEIILPALIGGLGVAIVAGPLGSFLVWRRMAYFGDTLAHSALLGVALGLALSVNLNLAVIIVCVLMAMGLVFLLQQRQIASDTLLGILAHTSLSLGLIVVSLMKSRLDLSAFLFGDLLAINTGDLQAIYLGGAVILITLKFLWQPLLAITVHEELAQVEGVPVAATRMALMVLMALVIAVAMKLVGVLLITALMIIPAASARRLATTPEQMAAFASALGCIAVSLGLINSYYFDTPLGPSIVVCSTFIFIIVYSLPLGIFNTPRAETRR